MIIYDGIFEKLSDAGWSTYRLQKEKVLGNGVITNIRNGSSITMRTVDTICELCDCQPGDILKYVPSKEQGK